MVSLVFGVPEVHNEVPDTLLQDPTLDSLVDEDQLEERLEGAPVTRVTDIPDTADDYLFAKSSPEKNETDVLFAVETLMAWQFEDTETLTISSRMGPDVQTTDRETPRKPLSKLSNNTPLSLYSDPKYITRRGPLVSHSLSFIIVPSNNTVSFFSSSST